ncbi:unnamed protein product, partial [Discosporangium mesarthrocarpum]
CAHVRRGDFERSCSLYQEEYSSGRARDWVENNFRNGNLCWVDEHEFHHSIASMVHRGPSKLGVTPLFAYITTDDRPFVQRAGKSSPISIFTLEDIMGEMDGGGVAKKNPGWQESTTKEISHELRKAALPAIDLAVCSRASVVVLNPFSTFSVLIKAKAKDRPGFVK